MNSKRTRSIAAVLLTLVLACTAGVNAQSLKRIGFASGKSSAAVNATTRTYGTACVLGAKAGQKMVITVTPAGTAGIKVETEGRIGHQVLLQREAGGRYEVGIEESGDHTIFICQKEDRPVSFMLKVKIAKLADL